MSLDNVSLKFRMLISEIHQYFFLKKCKKLLQCRARASFIFSNKIFGYQVVKNLRSGTLNELVKLKMLRTTGPSNLRYG